MRVSPAPIPTRSARWLTHGCGFVLFGGELKGCRLPSRLAVSEAGAPVPHSCVTEGPPKQVG
jgi:hypothetical protein